MQSTLSLSLEHLSLFFCPQCDWQRALLGLSHLLVFRARNPDAEPIFWNFILMSLWFTSPISLEVVLHVAADETNVANGVSILAPLSQGSNWSLQKPALKLLQFAPYHNKVNASLQFLSVVLIATKFSYLSLSAVLGMTAILSGSQCSKILANGFQGWTPKA